MHNIGNRIKFFRQRAAMSQMELELATDCAFGSISRLESGKVNPTRETVEYISQALCLSDPEIDYLSGAIALPATPGEISLAVAEVTAYLQKPGVLAYLIDERMRIHAYSQAFIRLFRLGKEQAQELGNRLLDRTLIEIMLKPELGIRDYLDLDNDYTLRLMLRSYYEEVAFMADDPYFIRTMEAINSDKQASRIWSEIIKEETPLTISTLAERKVYFKIGSLNFSFNFTNQNLHKHRRFKLVEYIPTNRIMRFLSQLG